MPAKQKYLSTTRQRFGKLTAGILGGFLVDTALHICVGSMVEDKSILVMTTIFSFWLVWIGLMILAFLARKPWKVWMWYGGLIIIFVLLYYFNR